MQRHLETFHAKEWYTENIPKVTLEASLSFKTRTSVKLERFTSDGTYKTGSFPFKRPCPGDRVAVGPAAVHSTVTFPFRR